MIFHQQIYLYLHNDLILNSSSFNYSLGHLGKNTENSNPKPISIFDFFDIACNQGFGGVEFPLFRFCNHESTNIEKIYDYLNNNNLFCQFDCGNPIDIDEIKKIIPIAKRFKSDIIRIKVSNILCCNRKIIDHGWDSFINSIITKLRCLIPYLNDYQIKLAIENQQDVDSLDLINIIDNVYIHAFPKKDFFNIPLLTKKAARLEDINPYTTPK